MRFFFSILVFLSLFRVLVRARVLTAAQTGGQWTGKGGEEGGFRRGVGCGCPCFCHFNSSRCDPIHQRQKGFSLGFCLLVSCRSYIHVLLVIKGGGLCIFYSFRLLLPSSSIRSSAPVSNAKG